MKKGFVLAGLLLAVAGLQTAWAQEAMKVYSGGNFTVYRIENVEQVLFVKLVGEIQLSKTSVEMEKGETLQLTAKVLPADADEKAVTWESSNPMAASVDEKGLVTAKGRGWTNIICRASDGSDVQAECYVKVNAVIVPGNHEYVDLGLPSGTLWATTNLGADVPEESGFYYAWGETEPKDCYNWETYKWQTQGIPDWTGITKYTFDDNQGSGVWYDSEGNFIGDGLTELLPEDDAATVNWGSQWQMPSAAQFQELVDNSDWNITEYNDVQGYLYTSKFNGNSIFFPCAGRYETTNFIEMTCEYWGRETLSCTDYGVYYNGEVTSTSSRCLGLPIRPVRK
ncbi:MAG: Ig-like domain-containing protein [Bacteroidaceae bacterium]|nr:Ig-like domain-containing protein [Bacteroidaceae bacterium]